MPFELIKPDTHIDFVGQAKYAIALSLADPGGRSRGDVRARARVRWASTSPAASRCRCASRRARRSTRPAIREVLGRLRSRGCRRGPARRGVRRRVPAALAPAIDRRPERAGRSAARGVRAKLGGVDVERVGFVGPKVGEDLRRDGIVSLDGRERAAVDLHRLPLHADLRAGRDRGAGPRRRRDCGPARDLRLRVRSHRARRAARDPRLQHQRQDRRLRPDPREPGAPHRLRLPNW